MSDLLKLEAIDIEIKIIYGYYGRDLVAKKVYFTAIFDII